MPDDDNDIEADLGKELNTPVEILESATLGCVEMLRRRRVCLYPGPKIPVQPGEITDFWECLDCLGDCNALIFCAPHHSKEEACARLRHCINGGDFDLIFDRRECVGVDHDWNWIWKDDLLFPQKSENLLVAGTAPTVEPQATRPPDHQFWALYAVLGFVGRDDKLHLLQLGLGGDHAWLFFLQPHGIQVSRMIANPP